jgi:hypothetical protein
VLTASSSLGKSTGWMMTRVRRSGRSTGSTASAATGSIAVSPMVGVAIGALPFGLGFFELILKVSDFCLQLRDSCLPDLICGRVASALREPRKRVKDRERDRGGAHRDASHNW